MNTNRTREKRTAVCLLAGILLLAGACGKKADTEGNGGYADDVSTQELRDAVAETLGEDYWPNMDMEAELLDTMYGVKPEMYEEVSAQMPMISAQADTLIIVKAREGQETAVADALREYRDYNISNGMQYPMNIGKVQAAVVEIMGRYVCFVQLGADTTAQQEEGDEAVIAYCRKANETAVEAMKERLAR